MTSILRTMRTIEINGKYRVRVGETEVGDFEATVVETHVISPIVSSFATLAGDDDPNWGDVEYAPTVRAEAAYIAAGKAVDEFIQAEINEIEAKTNE